MTELYIGGADQSFRFDTFLEMKDTPNSYSGEANKAVTVKGDETGLEFVDLDTLYLLLDGTNTMTGDIDFLVGGVASKIQAAEGVNPFIISSDNPIMITDSGGDVVTFSNPAGAVFHMPITMDANQPITMGSGNSEIDMNDQPIDNVESITFQNASSGSNSKISQPDSFFDSTLCDLDSDGDSQGFLVIQNADDSFVQVSNNLFRGVGDQVQFVLSLETDNATITNGNPIGRIRFRGLDTGLRTCAQIDVVASGTWGTNTNDAPADMEIYLQNAGSGDNLGAPAIIFKSTGLVIGSNADGILFLSETTTPTAIADRGAIYTKSNNELFFQDGAGVEHLLHGDAFSNIWFHDTSTVEVTISTEDAFTKIDSFTVERSKGFFNLIVHSIIIIFRRYLNNF